jgi:SNW domain-containing protein 1
VKQYPLDMGRKRQTGGNALQLRVDSTGKTNYDVVVREGQRKNKHIFTRASEMEEMEVDEESLARPTEEEAADIMKKTQEALDKKLKGR